MPDHHDNLPATQRTQHGGRLSTASLRAISTSALVTMTRSEADLGKVDKLILEQADIVLGLGYQPEQTDREKFQQRDAFRKALRDLPAWALNRAFIAWTRDKRHKPTPGDIRILVDRETRPIRDEIASRVKAEAARREAEEQARRDKPSPEERERILRACGFTEHRFAAARQTLMLRPEDLQPDGRVKPRDFGITQPDPEALARARGESALAREAMAYARARSCQEEGTEEIEQGRPEEGATYRDAGIRSTWKRPEVEGPEEPDMPSDGWSAEEPDYGPEE